MKLEEEFLVNTFNNIENNNSNDNNIVKTEPSPIYNKFTIETQNNYNYRTELRYSDLILELLKYWKKNNVKIKNESFNLYGLPKLNDTINSKIIKLDKIDRVINIKKDYKKDNQIETEKEKEKKKEKEKEKEKIKLIIMILMMMKMKKMKLHMLKSKKQRK